MVDDDDKDQDRLYRVDTVPPPEGESDAYNAPTKVGPMAANAIAEMMKAAGLDRAVATFNERVRPPGEPSSPSSPPSNQPPRPREGFAAMPPPPPIPSPPPTAPIPPPSSSGRIVPLDLTRVPRVYEDEEEEGGPLLGSSHSPASVGSISAAPLVPQQPPPPAFPSAFGPAAPDEKARPWIRPHDLLLIALVLAACGVAAYLFRC